jgi:hypothetical protein
MKIMGVRDASEYIVTVSDSCVKLERLGRQGRTLTIIVRSDDEAWRKNSCEVEDVAGSAAVRPPGHGPTDNGAVPIGNDGRPVREVPAAARIRDRVRANRQRAAAGGIPI